MEDEVRTEALKAMAAVRRDFKSGTTDEDFASAIAKAIVAKFSVYGRGI